MAAGEGTRLRPLTERYAKPVLPVDGRPVVVTLLHELRAAGIEQVVVVTGHLAHQVEALVAGFPLDVRFVRQPEPLGSADAVGRAEPEPPYVVAAADTAFTAGDVGRFLSAAEGADGAIAVRRTPALDPRHRHGVVVEDSRVVRFHADDSPVSGAPLWAVGPAVHELVVQRLGNPPWELGTAFQRAVDAGRTVLGVEIGPTRDLTGPLDLLERNFAYLRGL
jgi:NDP-sugar pyrophosphorylase family protein